MLEPIDSFYYFELAEHRSPTPQISPPASTTLRCNNDTKGDAIHRLVGMLSAVLKDWFPGYGNKYGKLP